MAQTQSSYEGPSKSGWRMGRKIRRVPEFLRNEKRNHDDYIPKVVSIGPYHCMNRELHFAQSFKFLALKEVLEVAGQQEDMCLQEIKKEITEIRNCYEECYVIDRAHDDELAQMMLLDACFITVHIIAGAARPFKSDNYPKRIVDLMFNHFGQLSTSIALRDMCLADNQIPFWIVKLLLSKFYTAENQGKVLDSYLTIFLFREFYSAKRTPRNEYGEAFHLLEHFHWALALDIHEPREAPSSHVNCSLSVKERTNADLESSECCEGISRFPSCLKKLRARVCKGRLFKKAVGDLKILGHSFHSMTELKANGIHLKPSPTQSLEDVNFKSNFMYAELQLPTLSACPDNKTLFLNMICYELDPETMSKGVVISYINLMKSLIVKPENVKELREKKNPPCLARK